MKKEKNTVSKEQKSCPGKKKTDPVGPVQDPPVPNRAWTEMKLGKDIDMLTEEEKRDLYIGHDNCF